MPSCTALLGTWRWLSVGNTNELGESGNIEGTDDIEDRDSIGAIGAIGAMGAIEGIAGIAFPDVTWSIETRGEQTERGREDELSDFVEVIDCIDCTEGTGETGEIEEAGVCIGTVEVTGVKEVTGFTEVTDAVDVADAIDTADVADATDAVDATDALGTIEVNGVKGETESTEFLEAMWVSRYNAAYNYNKMGKPLEFLTSTFQVHETAHPNRYCSWPAKTLSMVKKLRSRQMDPSDRGHPL